MYDLKPPEVGSGKPPLPTWPMLSALATVSLLTVGFLFQDDGATGRWLTYLSLLLLTLVFLLGNFARPRAFAATNGMTQTPNISSVLASSGSLLLVAGLQVYGARSAYATQGGYVGASIALALVVVMFFMGFTIIKGIRADSRSGHILFIYCGFLVVGGTSFLQLRSSLALRDAFFLEPVVVLGWSLFVGLLLGWVRTSLVESPLRVLRKKFVLVMLLLLSVLLALRVDGVHENAGSFYHLSYFVGPVASLRSGGTLLWDTPSQYGIGPVALAAVIPVTDPVTAVLVAQACLMVVVCSIALAALYLYSRSTKLFLLLGSAFVLLYFSADPVMVGPQPYPSSSAMRFGPSIMLLLALLLFLRQCKERQAWLRWIIGGLGAIALLWSFESFYYTSLILLGWLISSWYRVARKTSEDKEYTFSVAVIVLLSTAIAGLMIGLLVYVRTGQLPDLSMFSMYAQEYGAGFGAVPLTYGSPAWFAALVVVFLATAITLFMRTGVSQESVAVACMGSLAITGWLSYFVGRAVSDNIIAMLPQVYLVVGLTILMLSQASTLFAGESRARSSWRTSFVLFALAYFVPIFVTLLVSATSQSWLQSLRFLPSGVAWEEESVAGPDLADQWRSLPDGFRTLPVVFQGGAGYLPIPRESPTGLSFNSDVWLPSPLNLLEEPIPVDRQRSIISRFVAENPRPGLLVWNMADEARYTALKSAIAPSHSCRVLRQAASTRIEFCDLLKSAS